MSDLKWLNNLLFLEALLCIHRNYCSQKKTKQYLILFQIFVQNSLYLILISIKTYVVLGGWEGVFIRENVIYAFFSATAYLGAISSIVVGIYYSSNFMSYYRSVIRVSDWFKGDAKLIKSFKKMYWITLILTFLFIVYIAIRSIQVFEVMAQMNVIMKCLIFATQLILRFTVVYQYIMLVVVIMIVFYLSKRLVSLISAVEGRVRSCDTSSDEQFYVAKEQIQGWVEMYRDLANCCENVTLCHGRQYLLSLALSMPNYILTIYQICYQLVTDVSLHVYSEDLKRMILALFAYASTMWLPLIAGQFAQTQGIKFHRVLARLYSTMIIIDSGETEAKLIKDFIRLIKKNPIQIEILTNLPAGIYMLPVIITLTVNYVIVLLQFNHVI